MAAINTIAKEWTDELRAAPVQRKSTSTEERNQQQNGYAVTGYPHINEQYRNRQGSKLPYQRLLPRLLYASFRGPPISNNQR